MHPVPEELSERVGLAPALTAHRRRKAMTTIQIELPEATFGQRMHAGAKNKI